MRQMPVATKAWSQEDVLVVWTWINPEGKTYFQTRVVSRKIWKYDDGSEAVEYDGRYQNLRPKKDMMPFVKSAIEAGYYVGDRDLGGKPFPMNTKHLRWVALFDTSEFEELKFSGGNQ